MRALTYVTIGSLMLVTSPVRAEVGEVKRAQLYGIGYLPLIIVEHNRLLEQHTRQAGLGAIKVSWTRFAYATTANDAMLSVNLHFTS